MIEMFSLFTGTCKLVIKDLMVCQCCCHDELRYLVVTMSSSLASEECRQFEADKRDKLGPRRDLET